MAYHVPSKQHLYFDDARWIGASSTGKNSGFVGTNTLELSEVFLRFADNRLVALEAGAPDKGIVELGQLPDSSTELEMSGPGQGPHRLLRLTHRDRSVEILYVDTQREGSLRHLMAQPAVKWSREYTNLGQQAGNDIHPHHTRPLWLF